MPALPLTPEAENVSDAQGFELADDLVEGLGALSYPRLIAVRTEAPARGTGAPMLRSLTPEDYSLGPLISSHSLSGLDLFAGRGWESYAPHSDEVVNLSERVLGFKSSAGAAFRMRHNGPMIAL